MAENKEKKEKAVKKLKKAVKKAKNKGVSDQLIAKTVDNALRKSINAEEPKQSLKEARARKLAKKALVPRASARTAMTDPD